jgi:hypothetical protein
VSCGIAGTARIGFVTLVAAALTAAICGDAVAKVHKKRLHHRGFTVESREKKSGERLQFVSQEPVRLGAMRYYGGPKSPMWRGPAEN